MMLPKTIAIIGVLESVESIVECDMKNLIGIENPVESQPETIPSKLQNISEEFTAFC